MSDAVVARRGLVVRGEANSAAALLRTASQLRTQGHCQVVSLMRLDGDDLIATDAVGVCTRRCNRTHWRGAWTALRARLSRVRVSCGC